MMNHIFLRNEHNNSWELYQFPIVLDIVAEGKRVSQIGGQRKQLCGCYWH